MSNTKRSLEQVLQAIEGSGGVKSVVARRLGVTRKTFDSYLLRWTSARDALTQEEMAVGDIAKSLLVGNLRAAFNLQQEAAKDNDWARAVVDTGDAKWWLSRKLRDEFAARQEVVGADGKPLTLQLTWGDGDDDDSDSD